MCRSCGQPGETPRMQSFNYDAKGRRMNPQGGYYLIPADQLATVVARMQYDPRILNCFKFVPLPATPPLCPPTPPRALACSPAPAPARLPFARRR